MRTHLLRSVIPPLDAPESKLCVAALDGGTDPIGRRVSAREVRHLDDRLPGGASPAILQGLEVLLGGVLGPERGARLAAVLLDLDPGDALVGVGELAELGGDGGAPEGLGPLVEEAVDQLLHLRLERRADPQPVLEDDLLQVPEPAGCGELLDPPRRPLQPVRRPYVEHQVPVQDRDHLRRRHVLGQQLRVPRLGAAVAGYEDVESLLGCYETEASKEKET